MARFKPGTRLQYTDGVIYRVMPGRVHRREDGGGRRLNKAEKKKSRKLRTMVKSRKLRTMVRLAK